MKYFLNIEIFEIIIRKKLVLLMGKTGRAHVEMS
jgi:hypothetical protein